MPKTGSINAESGYCIGPGYAVRGPMVFDLIDHDTTFCFLIREDRDWTTDEKAARRENAVELPTDQVRKLFSETWLRKRLGLE